MSGDRVLLDVRDGVARLTLNRPDAANTIDLSLARELMEATLDLSGNPEVRSVLFRGAGSMFCAGGDLKSFAGQGDLGHHVTEVTTYLHAAVSRLARLEAPVVAAVHGSAAGAGLSLACSCDIVLAAESARFVLAYSRVGLTPDGSATWFLPRLIGLRRALELALCNRPLTAPEAVEWGLATRVVADADLDEEATRLVEELAQGPTAALAGAKRLLRGSLGESLEAQMELETLSLAASARGHDGREGIEAFLEKRLPRFTGQ